MDMLGSLFKMMNVKPEDFHALIQGVQNHLSDFQAGKIGFRNAMTHFDQRVTALEAKLDRLIELQERAQGIVPPAILITRQSDTEKHNGK